MNTSSTTSINRQLPGPIVVAKGRGVYGTDVCLETPEQAHHLPRFERLAEVSYRWEKDEGTVEQMANARLLAAAYTAFDRAGRALGVDAARLAEELDLTALIRHGFNGGEMGSLSLLAKVCALPSNA